MMTKSVSIAALFTILVANTAINAAPMYFGYSATITDSDRPGAPVGTALTGYFSYDPDEVSTIGANHYYPTIGTAELYAQGTAGFSLKMDTRAINVTPGAVNDVMTMQSFISEDPNGWNMVFDFIEPGGASGWLQGNSDLPSAFPTPLDSPNILLYFTDEGDWTRIVDATIDTITPLAGPPAVIPIPPAGILLGSGLVLLLARARKRELTPTQH